MAMVMGIVDRVLVLDFGRVIALGRPEETQANPDVIKAYLGEELSQDTQNAGATSPTPASAQASSSESGS
jgi:branched-chain amino acid transport system ATP-binding protein